MTPYRILVINSGDNREWRVYVGPHDITTRPLDLNPVGPVLDDKAKATQLACAVTQALRDIGVPLEPVITLPDSKALLEAIEYEIDTNIDAFNDDPWVEGMDFSGLESIKTQVQEDGSVPLDYDQATQVADLLPRAIETAEEIYADDPQLTLDSPGDVVALRRYARLLDRAGFPFEYAPANPKAIKLLDEASEEPYAAGTIGTAPTLSAAYRMLREAQTKEKAP